MQFGKTSELFEYKVRIQCFLKKKNTKDKLGSLIIKGILVGYCHRDDGAKGYRVLSNKKGKSLTLSFYLNRLCKGSLRPDVQLLLGPADYIK